MFGDKIYRKSSEKFRSRCRMYKISWEISIMPRTISITKSKNFNGSKMKRRVCCNLTLYMKRMTGVIMIIDWGGPSLKSYLSFVVTICSNQFLFSHNKMSLSIIVCQGIPKQLSVQLVAAIIEKCNQNIPLFLFIE